MNKITKMTDDEILNYLKNEKKWMHQLGYTQEEMDAMNESQLSIDEWETFLDFDEDNCYDFNYEILEPVFDEF